MDKEDLTALNRSRTTAGLSYLGAIIPILGWVLGIISLSNLSSIEKPETEKDNLRIAAVKKMAYGGIMLSTALALFYGGTSYWLINNNINQAKQADLQNCEQQVTQINNKVFAANSQYLEEDPLGEFKNTTNYQDCKLNIQSALNLAKSNYDSAISRAKERCVSAANVIYNNYLEQNATDKTKNTIE